MKTQEQIESERLDGETVFTASHSEIAQTRTSQCKMGEHDWRKIDEENLICNKCMSGIKVKLGTANQYVSK